jgi:CheY-like chemotaxis protein
MLESKNITILTVDDNDALRHSLSRMLMEGGYKVREARNGAEALRLADEGPDLITLDVHLPDTDGFEICRQLKSNPRTAQRGCVNMAVALRSRLPTTGPPSPQSSPWKTSSAKQFSRE